MTNVRLRIQRNWISCITLSFSRLSKNSLSREKGSIVQKAHVKMFAEDFASWLWLWPLFGSGVKKGKDLNYVKRLEIAVGVAQGLDYLHSFAVSSNLTSTSLDLVSSFSSICGKWFLTFHWLSSISGFVYRILRLFTGTSNPATFSSTQTSLRKWPTSESQRSRSTSKRISPRDLLALLGTQPSSSSWSEP